MPNFTSVNNAPKAIYIWDVFNPKMFLPRLSFNLGFIFAIVFGLIVIPGKAGAASLTGALQFVTAPTNKLIELNVSADYQPKTIHKEIGAFSWGLFLACKSKAFLL